MDWIKDNKGAGAWAFTKQPDKWGYLNNPLWSTQADARAFCQTPQINIPLDKIDEHTPCGHWHLREEATPPTYEILRGLVAEIYDIGYVDGDDYFYIPNSFVKLGEGRDIGLFKISTSWLEDTEHNGSIPCFEYYDFVCPPNEERVIYHGMCVIDGTNNIGYFGVHYSNMEHFEVWKINLSDMTYIDKLEVSIYGHLGRGFIYEGYLYAATYYTSITTGYHNIVKIDISTFTVVDSIPTTNYMLATCRSIYHTGNSAYIAVGGIITLLDLNTFTVITTTIPLSNDAAAIIPVGGLLLFSTGAWTYSDNYSLSNLIRDTDGDNSFSLLSHDGIYTVGWSTYYAPIWRRLRGTTVGLSSTLFDPVDDPIDYDSWEIASQKYISSVERGLWGGIGVKTGVENALLRWSDLVNYEKMGNGIVYEAKIVSTGSTGSSDEPQIWRY
jgi:hypothetical protein